MDVDPLRRRRVAVAVGRLLLEEVAAERVGRERDDGANSDLVTVQRREVARALDLAEQRQVLAGRVAHGLRLRLGGAAGRGRVIAEAVVTDLPGTGLVPEHVRGDVGAVGADVGEAERRAVVGIAAVRGLDQTDRVDHCGPRRAVQRAVVVAVEVVAVGAREPVDQQVRDVVRVLEVQARHQVRCRQRERRLREHERTVVTERGAGQVHHGFHGAAAGRAVPDHEVRDAVERGAWGAGQFGVLVGVAAGLVDPDLGESEFVGRGGGGRCGQHERADQSARDHCGSGAGSQGRSPGGGGRRRALRPPAEAHTRPFGSRVHDPRVAGHAPSPVGAATGAAGTAGTATRTMLETSSSTEPR